MKYLALLLLLIGMTVNAQTLVVDGISYEITGSELLTISNSYIRGYHSATRTTPPTLTAPIPEGITASGSGSFSVNSYRETVLIDSWWPHRDFFRGADRAFVRYYNAPYPCLTFPERILQDPIGWTVNADTSVPIPIEYTRNSIPNGSYGVHIQPILARGHRAPYFIAEERSAFNILSVGMHPDTCIGWNFEGLHGGYLLNVNNNSTSIDVERFSKAILITANSDDFSVINLPYTSDNDPRVSFTGYKFNYFPDENVVIDYKLAGQEFGPEHRQTFEVEQNTHYHLTIENNNLVLTPQGQTRP